MNKKKQLASNKKQGKTQRKRQEKSGQFRVCSYNIHKGFSSTNLRFLLADIRHAIRTIDSDFVFLQEVRGEDRHPDEARHLNQFEFLADSIWHHHAYGHNAIYDTGHHGNAILSKFPFSEWKNTNVSIWSFSQRGVLLGKTEIGIFLCCLHLGLFAAERRSQLNMLVELINNNVPTDAPLIIAGDFNDWSLEIDRKIRKQLEVNEAYSEIFGKPARTFPSIFPMIPVDRIYFRNIRLVDAEVLSGNPWQKLSDHCALTAIFER